MGGVGIDFFQGALPAQRAGRTESGPVQTLGVVVPGHGLEVIHFQPGISHQLERAHVSAAPVGIQPGFPQLCRTVFLGFLCGIGQHVQRTLVVTGQGQGVYAAPRHHPVLLIGGHFLLVLIEIGAHHIDGVDGGLQVGAGVFHDQAVHGSFGVAVSEILIDIFQTGHVGGLQVYGISQNVFIGNGI